jgi:hypothetical protein
MTNPAVKPDLAALAQRLRWHTPLRPRDLCRLMCCTHKMYTRPTLIPLRTILP